MRKKYKAAAIRCLLALILAAIPVLLEKLCGPTTAVRLLEILCASAAVLQLICIAR